MHSESALLRFAEDPLQVGALLFMALVYATRIAWFLHFKAGRERQGRTGPSDTSPAKGVLYSWAIIAMPWAMESTRKKFLLYAQFVVFHLGVAAAILLSFIIPYAPGLLESGWLVLAIQAITGAAAVMEIVRMVRRVGSPYMRAISSPDDYFSLALLIGWLFSAALAASNDATHGETCLLVFFFSTAFFLVYVPFSKISHYLYYPFTRYYLGKTMGYRGVYPVRRGPTVG